MNRSQKSISLVCRFFLFFLSLHITCIVFAQSKFLPVGQVDSRELFMKTCELDSTAAAMILLNYQETEIIPDYYVNKTITKFRKRIKIFSRSGFEYANIKFSLNYGKISDLVRYIHYIDRNGNPVSTKLTKDDIYKEKAKKGEGTLAFTFPNVTEGCIIEYEFTHTAKDFLAIPHWTFQAEIPTAQAFCKVTIPSQALLEDRIISPLTVETRQQHVTYSNIDQVSIKSYSIQDIPAFKVEPYMGSILDQLQRVEFALRSARGGFALAAKDSTNKWAYDNARVNDYLENQLKKRLTGADSLIAQATKLHSAMDKSNYLYQSVKRMIKWDNTQTFDPEDISVCWDKKEGSSAEINTLLLYLLRKSGVNSFPLLVSTKENGKPDPDFVNLAQFDGLDVVVIDSPENYILDATQASLSSLITPYNILNSLGFLIDGNKGRWLEIRDNRQLAKQTWLVMANVDSTGVITGTATSEYFDIAKHLRLKVRREKDQESVIKSLVQQNPMMKIENFTTSTPAEDKAPLTETFDFQVSLPASGDYYFIEPAFLSDSKSNPFTANIRHFDIDFGSTHTQVIAFNLELGEKLIAESLPKNISLIKSDSTINLRRITDVSGNTIRSMIRIDFKESQFPREEYPCLKEFFIKIQQLLSEPIIIRKKKA